MTLMIIITVTTDQISLVGIMKITYVTIVLICSSDIFLYSSWDLISI
jgi:hypothetical protein